MKNILVYKSVQLKDKDDKAMLVPNIGVQRTMKVPVLDYVGAFHQWIADSDGESTYVNAIVEKPDGSMDLAYINDVQFKQDKMQGATHKCEGTFRWTCEHRQLPLQSPYLKYSANGNASVWERDAWYQTELTNYELYSNDAYVEIST